VIINGHDIPNLAITINNLVQTGPIGKMVTYVFPQNQLHLLRNDSLSIFFDDTISGAGDGYAIDFVKLLLNLQGFAYTGTINGYIVDENTGLPIENARAVIQDFKEVFTDTDGYYEMTEVTAGINYLQVTKFGYDTASAIIDLVAGETIQKDFSIKKVLDAEFSASPVSGDSPLTVQFTDLSTQDPNNWHWDFGDGDTSDLQNPEHTYASDGLYTVKLKASNDAESNTEIKVDYIQVGPFGVDEAVDSRNLLVYPNPADGILNISFKGSILKQVLLYSISGQETKILRPENNTVDISDLQPGIYIVEVSIENKKYRKKLVVQ
jgi:PKD repeat protein